MYDPFNVILPLCPQASPSKINRTHVFPNSSFQTVYPYCLAADTNVPAAFKSVFADVATLNLAHCERPATCTPLERRHKHTTSICLTERLTPCGKVLLEKLTVPLLPATDEPPRFIAAIATARQLSLS